MVRFRYFNPLTEYAGFSPMGAARLTTALGMEVLRFDREPFATVHIRRTSPSKRAAR